jgi:hypothetical protein
MINLGNWKSSLYRGALVAQKYSPELLMGLGIGGIIGSTILACRATLKVEAIMTKSNENIAKINEVVDSGNPLYTEQDAQKDIMINAVQTGASLVSLYAPAAILGVISISCILTSHSIVTKRNLALMAAYKVVDESFKQYRDRVAAEIGPEKEDLIRHNTKQTVTTETVVNEDGKKVKQQKVENVLDLTNLSPYARVFDEFSKEYQKNADMNMFFLITKQNWANDMLHVHGHLFLNEVYDMLGMPRSQEGAIMGWVLGANGKDQKIDFGIYAPGNAQFVAGYERACWLDFNVDGIIWNLI